MWNRKTVKKRARHAMKRHYFRMVVLCFILAYFAGSYGLSGSMTLITSYDSDKSDNAVFSNIEDVQLSNSDVINELLNGVKETQEDSPPPENQKYTRGVFSAVFNSITQSGSVLFGILNVLNQFLFHNRLINSILVIAGTLITFGLWLFIQNILTVGQCRFFLESAVYEKTPLNRVLIMIRVRRWWNVVKIMFFKWLFTLLWSLTIIGGIIKTYSYLMVPFITAENPGIKRKEAFALSRKMMYGNKWKAFLLDFSFIGWMILSILTVGIVGIFFANPYTTAARTELYMALREKAIADKIPYYESLNDRYIGLHPVIPEGMTDLPEEYPYKLFSIPEHMRRQWIKVDFRRNYTLWSLILLFFTFSLIGWLWEVSLHLSTEGFVNRGVLHGPWLPIYGSGGVLVLVLLKKVRERPFVTFLMTVVICGVLEYSTSLFLEITKGKKWWDYSGYLLNLDGRICAEGLLVFGLGGCMFIYFAAPLFDELYKKIPVKVQIILCVLLLTVFGADQLYSHKHPNEGKGITDYALHLQVSPPNRIVTYNKKQQA